MPYVLQNRHTSEIFTCSLINIYDIPYHGAKYWNALEAAEKELENFLAAKQVQERSAWTLLKVEENQLKLFNVKLKNDPKRRLFMDAEGRTHTTTE